MEKAGRTLSVNRLGRYISLKTYFASGEWKDWLLSADKGPGAMIEASEAKYVANDMDGCVFELVLPSHSDDTPSDLFDVPSSNEVIILTRWGSVVYAPVAPGKVSSPSSSSSQVLLSV